MSKSSFLLAMLFALMCSISVGAAIKFEPGYWAMAMLCALDVIIYIGDGICKAVNSIGKEATDDQG